MRNKMLASILAVFLFLGISAAAVETIPGWSGIPGWVGPYPEGVTMFTTEDLSLHGALWSSSDHVVEGKKPLLFANFQIINSADKALTLLEPFHIYVRVYPANDVGGKIVYEHAFPALEGTFPAHSFFLTATASEPEWFGRDQEGKVLPSGEYFARLEMDSQFVFTLEGDDTVRTREVVFFYPREAAITVDLKMYRSNTNYFKPPVVRVAQQ